MLDYLRARAVDGVEEVQGDVYRRTVSSEGDLGIIQVGHEPSCDNVIVWVRFPNVRALPTLLSRVRRVFDIDADIETITAHLSRDPFLAPLLSRRPGLRAPGAWDAFELSVRAILGQQVSVAAARRLASRLAALAGERLPKASDATLTHAFPTPKQVAATDLTALGMPAARRAALRGMADAALADPDLFGRFATIEDAIARLRAIPGIGEWTAQYIALRALREPDAFPESDVGLLRSAGVRSGARSAPADLVRRAERWRPWRAYAAQHLWVVDAERHSNGQESRHV